MFMSGAGSRAPVGIFDSGLGGLSVLRAVRAQLPDEAILYVADSLYAPYGERDDDFIADRTLAIGEWLVKQGAKALVVACNTATAQSIALVREKLPIPLVGVEPGVKPAALQSKTRVAGVLATQVTLRSSSATPRIAAFFASRATGSCRPWNAATSAPPNCARCCAAICNPCSTPARIRWCSAARTTRFWMRRFATSSATG
jgi:glutamate racemase